MIYKCQWCGGPYEDLVTRDVESPNLTKLPDTEDVPNICEKCNAFLLASWKARLSA